jgi:hypothetical protein
MTKPIGQVKHYFELSQNEGPGEWWCGGAVKRVNRMTSIEQPFHHAGGMVACGCSAPVVGHDENQHCLGDNAFSSFRALSALLDDCFAILSLRSGALLKVSIVSTCGAIWCDLCDL